MRSEKEVIDKLAELDSIDGSKKNLHEHTVNNSYILALIWVRDMDTSSRKGGLRFG